MAMMIIGVHTSEDKAVQGHASSYYVEKSIGKRFSALQIGFFFFEICYAISEKFYIKRFIDVKRICRPCSYFQLCELVACLMRSSFVLRNKELGNKELRKYHHEMFMWNLR